MPRPPLSRSSRKASPRTSRALVETLNRAAREIAAANGWKVDENYDFSTTISPHARQCWNVAVAAYELIVGPIVGRIAHLDDGNRRAGRRKRREVVS